MNFDESKVEDCLLLECFSKGRPWEERQLELLRLFETYVYGRLIAESPVKAEVFEETRQALNGRATRRLRAIPGLRW